MYEAEQRGGVGAELCSVVQAAQVMPPPERVHYYYDMGTRVVFPRWTLSL